MEWFRVDSDFPRHPRIQRLARTLAIPIPHAIGHLTCLFAAVAEHSEDGSLVGIDDADLEMWGQWSGEQGTFAAALKAEDGLIVVAKGRAELRGWLKRHEQMFAERARRAENRVKDADRKRLYRQQIAKCPEDVPRDIHGTTEDVPRDTPGTVPPLSRPCPALSADPRARRVPTGPDRTGHLGDSPPDPQVPAAPGPTPSGSGELEIPRTKPADRVPVEAVRDLGERWNALAAELGVVQVQKLDEKRKNRARAAIKAGLLAQWDAFATALRGSAWYLGDNDRGWKADFDWLVTPGKWLALVERHAAGPAVPRGPPRHRRETASELWDRTVGAVGTETGTDDGAAT